MPAQAPRPGRDEPAFVGRIRPEGRLFDIRVELKQEANDPQRKADRVYDPERRVVVLDVEQDDRQLNQSHPARLEGPRAEEAEPADLDRVEAFVLSVLLDPGVQEGAKSSHPDNREQRKHDLPSGANSRLRRESERHEAEMGEGAREIVEALALAREPVQEVDGELNSCGERDVSTDAETLATGVEEQAANAVAHASPHVKLCHVGGFLRILGELESWPNHTIMFGISCGSTLCSEARALARCGRHRLFRVMRKAYLLLFVATTLAAKHPKWYINSVLHLSSTPTDSKRRCSLPMNTYQAPYIKDTYDVSKHMGFYYELGKRVKNVL